MVSSSIRSHHADRSRAARPRLGAALACLLLLATFSTASAQAQAGAIRVDLGVLTGEVGPYVYGVNYGPYSAVPVDFFPQLQAAGLDFIRFPGGRWGDLNDIRPNQLDMLMLYANLMEAETSIHVRLETGTPEQAAELVRYVNVERDLGVRHWYVGNEPSLYGEHFTVDDLNRGWRAIAEAMLAVDPDIMLVGPEPHQWLGLPGRDLVDANGREWVRGFLEANGDLIDVVAVHRYPFPLNSGNPVTTVQQMRENTVEWTQLISRLRALSEEVTGRSDLRYAVTEANSHWAGLIGGEATNDSHFNAIWWADVLGKLIVDGAYMVNYFDLHSADGRGGFGLFSNTGMRPSYYVYQLYQRFGSSLLEASSTAQWVSAYAARRDDGAFTLILTNLADEAQTVELELLGDDVGSFAEALLLDPDHSAASIPDPRSADGRSISLPARSAMLLVLH